MTSLCSRWRRALASACAAAALLTVSACSGDNDDGAAQPAPVVQRDLSSYDAFMIASVENNPLFADVYGLRFEPLVADRITTMKRISSMGADSDHLVVSAADGAVDRLAVVNGDGALTPVPGLGRPHAFSPSVVDGVMYYEVSRGDDVSRFFSYDLGSREKERLFDSPGAGGLIPTAGGDLIYGRSEGNAIGGSVIEIRKPSGDIRTLSFKADVYGGAQGTRWLASTINAPDAGFGDKPETLVLLNIKSGKTKRVDGLQAICFTPDGTRLLARRVGDPLSSPLVLIDPDKPSDVVEVGTVPGLAIYSGTWVRGDAPR